VRQNVVARIAFGQNALRGRLFAAVFIGFSSPLTGRRKEV
jgi:hypothetical protein